MTNRQFKDLLSDMDHDSPFEKRFRLCIFEDIDCIECVLKREYRKKV